MRAKRSPSRSAWRTRQIDTEQRVQDPSDERTERASSRKRYGHKAKRRLADQDHAFRSSNVSNARSSLGRGRTGRRRFARFWRLLPLTQAPHGQVKTFQLDVAASVCNLCVVTGKLRGASSFPRARGRRTPNSVLAVVSSISTF